MFGLNCIGTALTDSFITKKKFNPSLALASILTMLMPIVGDAPWNTGTRDGLLRVFNIVTNTYNNDITMNDKPYRRSTSSSHRSRYRYYQQWLQLPMRTTIEAIAFPCNLPSPKPLVNDVGHPTDRPYGILETLVIGFILAFTLPVRLYREYLL